MEEETRLGPPKEIKKISDVVWELPSSFKKGMRVPARIIASEKLIKEMDSGVFDQISNVATLPGIVNPAYCMPDGHWGYGFPIGGVAAFDVENEGVISPGGIGFDVNCINGDSKIIGEYGYTVLIKDFLNNKHINTKSIYFEAQKEISTKPILFLKKEIGSKIFEIKTKSDYKIVATTDHPFYTNEGMIKVKDLILKKHFLAVYPFDGVPYEAVNDKVILDEDNIKKISPDHKKIVNILKERKLLPLTLNSEKLPILTKLIGFLSGDGWLGYSYNRKRNRNQWAIRAIGKKENLLQIIDDLKKLGFKASHIKTKSYSSTVKEIGGNKRIICGESTQLSITSQSLAVLLHALGVPKKNKSRNPIFLPKWIKESPLWIKRLYLSGLFGAEMSSPIQAKNEKYRFKEPSFSQNKILALENSLKEFLQEIKDLLKEFNIDCTKIYKQKGVINKFGEETIKIILKLSSTTDNLINLWGKIGFEYCEDKKRLSLLSLQYLKFKKAILNKIDTIVENSFQLKNNGLVQAQILRYAEDNNVSSSLIKSRLYNNCKNIETRISKNFFLSFNKFILKYGLKNGGDYVWDEIESIKEVEDSTEVYDFTINHKDHNFIANNFIISNCGMRLLLTNLTYDQFKPHLKNIVDTLFKRVPAGVGGEGFVKIDKQEFLKVLEGGAHWAVKEGYGWEEDLEVTELNGKADWADVSKISKKAIDRGYNQIGTLGSGNHYLEIQRVKEENIFDKKLAKKWGIFPEQIVIMFHTGSRGEGHQIATDYLRVFLDVMDRKYNIKILDRELACAPFNSPEGQDYWRAMACAVNFSFANRQTIAHRIREVFSEIFKKDAESLGMKQVFDIAHNRASLEEHKIDGKNKKLLIHRKGATAAYYPGRKEIPKKYREDGSPIIIGGSMSTGSYLLAGTEDSKNTFCSTAHGSGRTMSRNKAARIFGKDIKKYLDDLWKEKGIYIRSTSLRGAAEETGESYKDINEVIKSTHLAGISKPVVRFLPIGNCKG